MGPPRPSLLDVEATGKKTPIGWEGSKFPLTKLDLTKITLEYTKQSRFLRSPRQTTARRLQSLNVRRRQAKAPSFNYVPSRTCKDAKVVSEAEKGWRWLSVQFEEIRGDKWVKKSRKGELSPEIIDAIWGHRNTRPCKQTLDSLHALGRSRKLTVNTGEEIAKIQENVQATKGDDRSEDNLMDILLHNWTYFEHSHATFGSEDKEVHAKYCENDFGHFLLSNGQQIHGQFNVQLRVLLRKLRKLLQKLRSQILPTSYQELPAWRSPRLEQDPELELPAMPLMPQLYPISGLIPIPTEQDECIPNDYPAPVFKSPIPKEHPPLILPELLKVPPLILPAMPMLIEDESSIDYDSYKEEPLPIFTAAPQEPLPEWIEPLLTELPPEPEYLISLIIPPPIRESVQPFRPPLLEPRPCERSYYELGKDERGICDGLCSKYGHKRHFVPGQRRREPCLAKPLPMPSLPPIPFPEAEAILLSAEFQEGGSLDGLQIIPEPPFELPPEEPIPPFQTPDLKEEPKCVPLAPLSLPPWKPPKPPPPLGWIAGNRPVFLVDCSAAMAGARMETVQNCLKALFSRGGQGNIAITHFDIIMYSFDSWSFGDIENSFAYKQTAGSRYMRQLEPMRVNTPETVNAALNWMSRWRPAGTTNLSKALGIAMSRISADCIYLFTEGRSDKPVLILKQVQSQRESIPIYAVGIDSNKAKARFLKRLSEVTGGQYLQMASSSSSSNHVKPPPETIDDKEEDVDDTLWSQQRIEDYQREDAAAGRRSSMEDIYKKVESEYLAVRSKQRAELHEKSTAERNRSCREEVERIRSENAATMSRARREYEELVSGARERNRARLEAAREEWRERAEAARARNEGMVREVAEWREAVARAKREAEKAVAEARQRFARDVKEVEERNARSAKLAREHHEAEAERMRRKHKGRVEEVERRQRESDERAAAINKAAREEYESKVGMIREWNAASLAQARAAYEEALERAKARNAAAAEAAREAWERRCEETRRENARRKSALERRIREARRRREEALAAHRAEASRAVAEHEATAATYGAMNSELAARAREAWKRECAQVDDRNVAAARKAMEEFEAERARIGEENARLVERRLALRRRAAQAALENEETVKRRKAEWKAECERVEKEYEARAAAAHAEHRAAVERARARNAERLQSALVEHRARVAAAAAYNDSVRPYVEASDGVHAEIRRVEAFLHRIADSVLPPHRHVVDKPGLQQQQKLLQTSSKSSRLLDKDLDLLAVSDAVLSTDVLIDALECAYGKSWRTTTAGRPAAAAARTSRRDDDHHDRRPSRSRFSGMLPIHPPRAPVHSC